MKNILWVLLFIPLLGKSQKKNSLIIYIPQSIQKGNLDILYYNGKDRKIIPVNNSDSIIIRDTYYSEHSLLQLSYRGSTPLALYYALFYFDEKPAEIRFLENDPSDNIFAKVKLKNVTDAGPLGLNQMNEYVKKEHEDVIDAVKNMQASPGNDSLRTAISLKVKTEQVKKLKYIRDNGNHYFSFYAFGQDFTNSTLFSVDSLLYIFNHAFPAKFRNSYEGKEILAHLKIRSLREKEHKAPDFAVRDINNNIISLNQYKKKYVLINFWASWCVPCVQEFPILDKLTSDIPDDKLVKIFITEDKDTLAFDKARKKYHLQGIHIFTDSELIKKYKAASIPQLYLIDKEGKIIYDRGELKDGDLIQLSDILKKVLDHN